MCDRLLILSTNRGVWWARSPSNAPAAPCARPASSRTRGPRVSGDDRQAAGERVCPKTERFHGTAIGTTLTHVLLQRAGGPHGGGERAAYNGRRIAGDRAGERMKSMTCPAAGGAAVLRLRKWRAATSASRKAGIQFATPTRMIARALSPDPPRPRAARRARAPGTGRRAGQSAPRALLR